MSTLSALQKTAFIERCPHGHHHCEVVFADGSRSPRIHSISQGREVLRTALDEGHIDKFERDELSRQIGDFGFGDGESHSLELVISVIESSITEL